ncbi:Protein of unknown function [Methylomagnum ishizawai]|uniref:Inner membrane protein YgaP-like transmembrane domain-containing protein n=1 Tax=Methylomagnum ishizawai TaxID=1760988 RepID=A0A1Y6CYD3_9GAMM|nr:DUF2892 domain-containing protein [Methylomagnum ishizawai]SMF95387.1 Protein of unknown function [Methylomagnum ishizawai]
MAIDLCKKNIGPTEKYIRIGAGGLLTVLAGVGVVGAWGFIGLVPLATGLLGSCPVYTLMGKDTNGGTAQAETHAHGGACCGGSATPAEPTAATTAPEAPAEEPSTPTEAAAEASAEATPTAEEKPAA